MLLSVLCKDVHFTSVSDKWVSSLEVSGVSTDSRTVKKGDVFICLEGTHQNSTDFIPEALNSGAAAVILPDSLFASADKLLLSQAPYARVKSARLAASLIWNSFYENPAEDMKIICVTGTNGKTTVSYLLRSILIEAGHRVGMIGTVCSSVGYTEIERDSESENPSIPGAMTTPDPKYLYKTLRQMKDMGCTHVIIEASSHALFQKKLDALRPCISVFTNLTPEHLDFHGNMEEYLRAKAHLFELSETGILNGYDCHAERIPPLAPHCRYKFLGQKRNFSVSNTKSASSRGVSYDFHTNRTKARISLGIPGYFNIINSALSAACAAELGIPLSVIRSALSSAEGVRGRMEKVYEGEYTVILDFAHTPEALECALCAAKGWTSGRLICVFGCGGDRDRTKRAPMGECATRIADLTVITSDNCRGEKLSSIIEDILCGVHHEKDYTVIPSRKDAIFHAVLSALPGDTVMLCGKGHETYEIDRYGKHPFDERMIVAEAVLYAKNHGEFE